ncbi:uncharacterized protein LOC111712647 [Eurytemora carolleeae]|uniref:uncharacterized protein LOC111712647 n=1 Tax=Eurytemora carolleeae TaxID=1294199 RepID=UPI000C75AECD|nr:uncharacterized protein LOC111712647 [Eurytemora carolleeae]|eukprot:XP_023343095.1 uncharacterized protein LOC111712647 [Eurytemora affinis]
MQGFLALAVTIAVVAADSGYAPAPEYLCRDTNTSIYAEVCVPAFAEQITPVTLAVKEVVDNDYCFDRVLTVCEETSSFVDREICTYEYAREDVVADCTTTQVTYAEKSETMKVTTCSASGYGTPGYGAGEHQYCREEYQTQAYRVPLVTEPKLESCKLAYPAPSKVCVTKTLEIVEVKCEDKVERECFNVAKFQDATNTVDQKEIIIGEPSCEQLTLTLPTQACSKNHPKPYHG